MKVPVMKRTPADKLPDSQCFICVCAKAMHRVCMQSAIRLSKWTRYKKTSIHSITRHKEECIKWLQENPIPHVHVSREIENWVKIAKEGGTQNLNFSNIFSKITTWGEFYIGRFVADPSTNLLWADPVACKILGLDESTIEHEYLKVEMCDMILVRIKESLPNKISPNITSMKAFENTAQPKVLLADVVEVYTRKESRRMLFEAKRRNGKCWNQLCLKVVIGKSQKPYLLGWMQDITHFIEAVHQKQESTYRPEVRNRQQYHDESEYPERQRFIKRVRKRADPRSDGDLREKEAIRNITHPLPRYGIQTQNRNFARTMLETTP
eukprot:jgi/Bigna1/88856/estExt_fgenesh1_pg.C_390091